VKEIKTDFLIIGAGIIGLCLAKNLTEIYLTNYAANLQAEKDIIPLADKNFIVITLRFSTVFEYSPRMRFDFAINGMTYSAWKNR